MTAKMRVLFGPAAAVLLLAGMVFLALRVPGYSQVRQTVSEIGEVGSPMQLPFTVLLFAVAAGVLVFATGLRDFAHKASRSTLAAYVTGAMAISAAGVGYFSYPHPLHNVFGLSELVGYQAPLVLALTWRKDPSARGIVAFSWLMAVAVWAAIALNLTPMFKPPALWPQIRPVLGLVQRSLFAAWFAWCAGVGLMLSRKA